MKIEMVWQFLVYSPFLYWMKITSSVFSYEGVMLPHLLKWCASIAVQSLYTIPILTVTISVHTVTNMYSSHVPVLQYSHCIQFQSSLSLYQCTLLPICTVAMYQYCSTVTVYNSNPHCHYISVHCYQYVKKPCTSIAVQSLYTIPILTVN
jgi:hypothetical protein